MSKYTALLQIQTAEYFTSLAAGIARGAPAFLTGGIPVFISRSVACPGSASGFRGRGPVFWADGGFSFTHTGIENHLRWVARSKETITGGNSVLFSKLIFKASPKARLLRLARLFNKKSNMNLHKAKMSNSVTLGSRRRMPAKWLANSLTFRPRRAQLLGEDLLLGLCSAVRGASWKKNGQ